MKIPVPIIRSPMISKFTWLLKFISFFFGIPFYQWQTTSPQFQEVLSLRGTRVVPHNLVALSNKLQFFSLSIPSPWVNIDSDRQIIILIFIFGTRIWFRNIRITGIIHLYYTTWRGNVKGFLWRFRKFVQSERDSVFLCGTDPLLPGITAAGGTSAGTGATVRGSGTK